MRSQFFSTFILTLTMKFQNTGWPVEFLYAQTRADFKMLDSAKTAFIYASLKQAFKTPGLLIS